MKKSLFTGIVAGILVLLASLGMLKASFVLLPSITDEYFRGFCRHLLPVLYFLG
jgi:hypothetical protein